MQQEIQQESLLSLIERKQCDRQSDIKQISGSVAVFNTESVFHYFRNSDFRDYISECNHIFVDGVALVLVGRFLGYRLSRFHGPDLLEEMEKSGLLAGAAVIGGSTASSILCKHGVIANYYDLPFESDVKKLVNVFTEKNSITKLEPRLFISLGLPKQELFAKELINAGLNSEILLVPIGAATDFRAGIKKRSARGWQKLGLEWLPRLVREPRMLFRLFLSLKGLSLLVRQHIRSTLNFKEL